MKILSIFGTRPEAIKMAPIIQALKQTAGIETFTWVTGQHREMLDQMLYFFDITPDLDLDVMQPNQTLDKLTSNILTKVTQQLTKLKPDWVLVQGDTTSAMACALAAFYNKIPVAHIEAGLRTGNPYSPFPEEMNRKLISQIASIHFTPTTKAAQNLYQDGIKQGQVHITGNSVIDALLMVKHKIQSNPSLNKKLKNQFNFLSPNKRLILVTGHRRENWGTGLTHICEALKAIAVEHPDVDIIYPVHLNPAVHNTVFDTLSNQPNIHLCPPIDYVPFVYLMQRAYIIVTDSGGVQEEAPSLGVPILVTRESTERPEGIEAGVAQLVGTQKDHIKNAIEQLLSDSIAYSQMASLQNPYGDGNTTDKIIKVLMSTQTSLADNQPTHPELSLVSPSD